MQNMAQETARSGLCRQCKHGQVFADLDRAFSQPAAQNAAHVLEPRQAETLQAKRQDGKSYVSLHSFKQQTRHDEPFHLLTGPGAQACQSCGAR